MARSEKRSKARYEAPRVASGRQAVGMRSSEPGFALELTRRNWTLLVAAVALTLGGFIALSIAAPGPSTLLAPALLVAGYAVLAPLGLIL